MTGDKPKNEQGQGRLVVLLGPSAVGKSTVVHRLREKFPSLYFSVSMTTRDPRPGEVDGRDYFYVTREEFQEKIDAGEMLEWADIHGGLQRSGTPAGPVRDALSEGRPVLVEVDIVGARNVARMMPEANTVFLAPPSWERSWSSVGRGTEPQDVIDRRLKTAKAELAAKNGFHVVVVNDDIDRAVAEITEILLGRD